MFSAPLIKNFCARTPLRAGSLIVTIFGDCIAPRGGIIWLGSLIKILDRVGVTERLVRTSVFRLVKEGVLLSEKDGRRSFYSLSNQGQLEFEKASKQIYSTTRPAWNGQWTLLLLAELSRKKKLELAKALRPLGFRGFAPNVWGAPTTDSQELKSLLVVFGASSKVVVLNGNVDSAESLAPLKNMMFKAWELDALHLDYEQFNKLFMPVLKTLKSSSKKIDREDAFLLRTFVVHEYRKLVLRDPGLPKSLLPANWPASTSNETTAQLYQLVLRDSELFVDEQFINEGGMLPRPNAEFFNRFAES